jgi:hypothetical protein
MESPILHGPIAETRTKAWKLELQRHVREALTSVTAS